MMKPINSLVLLLILLLTLASCATVAPAPYTSFSASLRDLSNETDLALASAETKVRNSTVDKMANDQKSTIGQNFILTKEGYAWEMEEMPLFMKFRVSQKQVNSLNQSFIAYSDLLAKIAGSEVSDTKDLESIAADLNKTAISIGKTGKSDISKESPLLSSIAIGALKSYIDSKKSKFLNTAILENQDNIKKYADMGSSLIHVLRSASKKHYNESFKLISIAWSMSTQNVSEKKRLAKELFKLNDDFISSLASLKELDEAFQQIPIVHLALNIDEKNKKLFKVKLDRISESVKNIQRIQKNLKGTE